MEIVFPSVEDQLEVIRVFHPRLTVKEANIRDLACVGIDNLSGAEQVMLGRLFIIAEYNRQLGASNG